MRTVLLACLGNSLLAPQPVPAAARHAPPPPAKNFRIVKLFSLSGVMWWGNGDGETRVNCYTCYRGAEHPAVAPAQPTM